MNIKVIACLTLYFSIICITVTTAGTTCQQADQPLVSGPNGVADSALTASSSYDSKHGPHRARLHTVADATSNVGAWCAGAMGFSWIQVKLKDETRILKVQTQGRSDQLDLFVSGYTVSTSRDCISFTAYEENGLQRHFTGNYDQNTVVTQTLNNPPLARCVRIHAQAYRGHPCLRFDLIGGDSYRMWSQSRYKLIQEKLSWPVAAAYCKWEGGDLVTINSIGENDWLKDCLVSLTEGAEHVWFNLNRITNHYEWVTRTDNPATFYNWDRLQPKGSYVAENCAAMSQSGQYKWVSSPCGNEYYFICEK